MTTDTTSCSESWTCWADIASTTWTGETPSDVTMSLQCFLATSFILPSGPLLEARVSTITCELRWVRNSCETWGSTPELRGVSWPSSDGDISWSSSSSSSAKPVSRISRINPLLLLSSISRAELIRDGLGSWTGPWSPVLLWLNPTSACCLARRRFLRTTKIPAIMSKRMSAVNPMLVPRMTMRREWLGASVVEGVGTRCAGTSSSNRHCETEKLERS